MLHSMGLMAVETDVCLDAKSAFQGRRSTGFTRKVGGRSFVGLGVGLH